MHFHASRRTEPRSDANHQNIGHPAAEHDRRCGISSVSAFPLKTMTRLESHRPLSIHHGPALPRFLYQTIPSSGHRIVSRRLVREYRHERSKDPQ